MTQTNFRLSGTATTRGNLALQDSSVEPVFAPSAKAANVINFEDLCRAHIEGAGGWPDAAPCMPDPHVPASPSDSRMLVYAPHPSPKMTILVCETFESYANVRDLLKQGQRRFFGQRIDGVAYGSQRVLLAPLALEQVARGLGNADGLCFTALGGAYRPKVAFLYWGSIDRAHVLQLLRLYQANPGFSIRPFVPAYRYMLDAAYDRALPRAPHGQQSSFFLRLEPHFTPMQKSTYRQVLMDQLRIPQGIVTKRVLRAHAKA